MTKPTIATVKAFIRRNRENLLIRRHSSFDGWKDCVQECGNREFRPVGPVVPGQNTYGIAGAWFVGRSRDYVKPLDEDGYTGFNIYNCCGEFDLAVKS